MKLDQHLHCIFGRRWAEDPSETCKHSWPMEIINVHFHTSKLEIICCMAIETKIWLYPPLHRVFISSLCFYPMHLPHFTEIVSQQIGLPQETVGSAGGRGHISFTFLSLESKRHLENAEPDPHSQGAMEQNPISMAGQGCLARSLFHTELRTQPDTHTNPNLAVLQERWVLLLLLLLFLSLLLSFV